HPDAVLAADTEAAAWGAQVVAPAAVLGPESGLATITPLAEPTDRIALRRALRPPRRATLVLHGAPLTAGQHHESLLRRLAGLRPHSDSPPTLAFLGTGPAESDLHVLAQDLGVKDHVLWLGFRRDPAPYIGACDVFVPANEADGESIRAARAHGTAVVAANTA